MKGSTSFRYRVYDKTIAAALKLCKRGKGSSAAISTLVLSDHSLNYGFKSMMLLFTASLLNSFLYSWFLLSRNEKLSQYMMSSS